MISTFDTNITFFLAGILPHNTFFDVFFGFFSLTGNFIFIWLAILVLLFVYEEIKHIHIVYILLMSLALTFILVDYVLKPTFQRQRPYVVQNIDSPVCPKSFSFPSGHAAGAFAGATVLIHFDKKRKGWYYSLASLVAFSRIYLFCHFLLDIFFGALVGYLITLTLLHFLSYNKHLKKSKGS